MRSPILLFLITIMMTVFISEKASAQSRYAYKNCEYTIDFPESPSVKTLFTRELEEKERPSAQVSRMFTWKVPINPFFVSIGEHAVYKRVDPNSGEYLNIQTTCFGVDREYLRNLTPEKIKKLINRITNVTKLKKVSYDVTNELGDRQWVTMQGYFLIRGTNKIISRTTHVLTGARTLMVIEAEYSADNPTIARQYSLVAESIHVNIE